MRVLVSGSRGLIGSALVSSLRSGGHEVRRLVRGEATSDDVAWDPRGGTIDGAALEGTEAVVHLAGEGIAAKRWSRAHKREIRDSRVQGTRLLAEALARLDPTPGVLVSASGINVYGSTRGEEALTEESAPGEGFLAGVCREWEAATAPAAEAGIRVVTIRSGIVLSPSGGALKKQLPLFKLGLGGNLGSGWQFTSWISVDDEVGAIEHALATPALRGPLNLTAPNPVRNAQFTKTLGRVLNRPTFLAVPRFALAVVLGREMAAELLGSLRVLPARLEASGYAFRHPELEAALRHLLGR
ncbi:MAG: TIGR01777 family oxidoreductase [Actinomycetota bacterium]|nr:TIGR01777 family oxidoreductase [Actinomycetota bacterium]